MHRLQRFGYTAGTTVAVLAVTLGPASPAHAANDGRIGRGVVTAGSSGGGGLGGTTTASGDGKLKHLGKGTWSWSETFNCLGDEDQNACTYSYTFQFTGRRGSVAGTSDNSAISVRSSDGWAGTVRLQYDNAHWPHVKFYGSISR